jgi:hypothetical protein
MNSVLDRIEEAGRKSQKAVDAAIQQIVGAVAIMKAGVTMSEDRKTLDRLVSGCVPQKGIAMSFENRTQMRISSAENLRERFRAWRETYLPAPAPAPASKVNDEALQALGLLDDETEDCKRFGRWCRIDGQWLVRIMGRRKSRKVVTVVAKSGARAQVVLGERVASGIYACETVVQNEGGGGCQR